MNDSPPKEPTTPKQFTNVNGVGVEMLRSTTSMSVLFIGIGALLCYVLFVACGDASGPGAGCVFDDECGEDTACVDGFCFAICATDQNCTLPDTCQSRFRLSDDDLVNVCLPDEVSNQPTNCDTNADCVAQLENPLAECTVDKLCFVPERKFALLVRDLTVLPDPIVPGQEGAEIAAIYLEDDQGNIVAQADTLVIQTANDVPNNSKLNGGPPNLNADQTCTNGEFETDTTVLGGADGFLLVRFLDSGFNEYGEPPDNWNVVIVEWGDNCDANDDMDTYEVRVCSESSFENIDPERHCDVVLGQGSGLSRF